MSSTRVITSGFVDLQVNGHQGVDFSSPTLSLPDILRTTKALRAAGTAAYLATVVTSSEETYNHVLPLLAEAMTDKNCRGCLLGIHLEGPFISPGHEVVGVHPEKFVRDPSINFFESLQAAAAGNVRLLTLAPEQPGAIKLIERARAGGVSVGIGHTLADDKCIRQAIDAGASLSVHLGNGCPNMIHRHHNPLWPQLAAPELTTALITDGHHLPPSLIRVACAAKGFDRLIVVSDSTSLAGCEPGEYEMFGSRVRLEASGLVRNLEKETLAGSSSSMLECMNYLSGLNIFGPEELLRIGRSNPLRLIGLDESALVAEDATHPLYEFEQGTFRPTA